MVEEIGEIYSRADVRFPWREGDVLMLDNMLVAHARLPFTGARKIVVAMGEMIDDGSGVARASITASFPNHTVN